MFAIASIKALAVIFPAGMYLSLLDNAPNYLVWGCVISKRENIYYKDEIPMRVYTYIFESELKAHESKSETQN